MTSTETGEQWHKVHYPNEEYPWVVRSLDPEFLKAHCYHEADADRIIRDHQAAAAAGLLLKVGNEMYKWLGVREQGQSTTKVLAALDDWRAAIATAEEAGL